MSDVILLMDISKQIGKLQASVSAIDEYNREDHGEIKERLKKIEECLDYHDNDIEKLKECKRQKNGRAEKQDTRRWELVLVIFSPIISLIVSLIFNIFTRK